MCGAFFGLAAATQDLRLWSVSPHSLDAGLGLSLFHRKLRMCHVPGPTTHAVAARRRPLSPRADVARVSCEGAWRCIAAGKSSVSDAQQSARDGCVDRDERLKDDGDAKAEGSDSLE